MKDGIINIYKEKGYTSFDVIAKLRGMLKIKRLGHTGTLDPEAEGVLPVCIGKATKAADYITDKTKVYAASMRLGAYTDTQDHTGEILSTHTVTQSAEEVIKTIESFIGPYQQIPPMYSALKVNGKKLYELARAGKTIERKPREIIIYNIADVNIKDKDVFLRVTCSKGTYIRTLCNDIGEKLGCGAYMTSLVRERTGNFLINDSLKLQKIDELVMSNDLDRYVLPVDKVFEQESAVSVAEKYNKWLYNGNKIEQHQLLPEGNLQEGYRYRVYDEKGTFIGVYLCVNQINKLLLKPVTLFI